MRAEGKSVDDINLEMEKTAIDLKIPSPPRAFDDPSVEYVSTEYLLKNVARGNPTRYNVQEIDEFKAGNLGENPGTKQQFIEEGRPSLKESIYNEGIKSRLKLLCPRKTELPQLAKVIIDYVPLKSLVLKKFRLK